MNTEPHRSEGPAGARSARPARLPVALAGAWLLLALGGAPAQDSPPPEAEPAAETPAEPPAERPAPPARAEEAQAEGGDAAPRPGAPVRGSDDVFIPSEEIAADEEVVFPVDI